MYLDITEGMFNSGEGKHILTELIPVDFGEAFTGIS